MVLQRRHVDTACDETTTDLMHVLFLVVQVEDLLGRVSGINPSMQKVMFSKYHCSFNTKTLVETCYARPSTCIRWACSRTD